MNTVIREYRKQITVLCSQSRNLIDFFLAWLCIFMCLNSPTKGLLCRCSGYCFSCMFTELSLTPHNLSTVLDSMDDILWGQFSHCVNIPVSEQERIRRQYSSAGDRKQAIISLFIYSHPARSWKLVANALYQLGSRTVVGDGASCHTALNHLRKLFPTGI